MAQGLLNNGVSITKNFTDNEYELLADVTVTGSAITSYTFSGLEINADEEVILVSDVYNTVLGNGIKLFANGNTTLTNYYTQYIDVDSTTISSNRNNSNDMSYCPVGYSFIITNIKLTNNGYFTFQAHANRNYGGSGIMIKENYITSTFTLSQITSLTVSHASTNGIAIGSRFQLYKVKGTVQQTWATT